MEGVACYSDLRPYISDPKIQMLDPNIQASKYNQELNIQTPEQTS